MRFKKGSAEAKAWGRKMQRLRNGKVFKSKASSSGMARKRRSTKRSHRRSVSHAGFGKEILEGAAGYLVYEMFVAPRIPVQDNAKAVGEALVGYYLGTKSRMPILRNAGKVTAIVKTVALAGSYTSGFLGTGGSSSFAGY